MSKENCRGFFLEKKRNSSNRDKKEKTLNPNLLSKQMNKVYPTGIPKSSSGLSLSSLSLSLSQNSSNDSFTSSTSTLEQRISCALRMLAQSRRRQFSIPKSVQQVIPDYGDDHEQGLKRCNWITQNSDKVYVQFHDECWGVPVYDDNELFELLALSGMLMHFNWTEILKRKQLFREAFSGFDPSSVAKMGEKEIIEIASNKAIMLAESRVRCIVDNAKCILKIVEEIGSLSGYMWGYVDYKPIINGYKHSRNIPLRAPKAEAISKDLLKRGFRFVGPVIVYSFMQASGMTIDHLVDCFRFNQCVSLAQRPWRHV